MGHQSQPCFSDNNFYVFECYMFWLLYKPRAGKIFLFNCMLYVCIKVVILTHCFTLVSDDGLQINKTCSAIDRSTEVV